MDPSAQSQQPTGRPRKNGLFLWAIGGVLLLLTQAIVRLGQIAWEALTAYELSNLQLIVTVTWVVMSAYLEGYRGFQQKFVPRVIARAHYLAQHPDPLAAVFAPAYAMAFFRATVRARMAAWGVSLLVILAIFVVRAFPQPWRGIVDVGVVVGLSWGFVCLLIGSIRRVGGHVPTGDPELLQPGHAPSPTGA